MFYLTDKLVQCSCPHSCLLYTSDAADDMQCVDLGGRRIIKKERCEVGADVVLTDGR